MDLPRRAYNWGYWYAQRILRYPWCVITTGMGMRRILWNSSDAVIHTYDWPPFCGRCRNWGSSVRIHFKVELYGPWWERGTGFGVTLLQAAKRAEKNLRKSGGVIHSGLARDRIAMERTQEERKEPGHADN